MFLGHKVNLEGVALFESTVTAIQNFPRPSNMKQLRRFLGMLKYYRRFIPAAAATLQPLNRMLSSRKYSRQTLRWNEEAEEAFSAIKTKLIRFPCVRCRDTGGDGRLNICSWRGTAASYRWLC